MPECLCELREGVYFAIGMGGQSENSSEEFHRKFEGFSKIVEGHGVNVG